MEQKIQPTHRRFLSSRSLPRQSGQIWILSHFGPCHRQMPQRILKHYHSARSLKLEGKGHNRDRGHNQLVILFEVKQEVRV